MPEERGRGRFKKMLALHQRRVYQAYSAIFGVNLLSMTHSKVVGDYWTTTCVEMKTAEPALSAQELDAQRYGRGGEGNGGRDGS